MPSSAPLAAVILAAGKGTRMKSDLHKVLHPLAGQPMIAHLLHHLDCLDVARKVIVTGSGREQVEGKLAAAKADFVTQEPQLGTAHAVQQAERALEGFEGDILIMFGDVPLVTSETMRRMVERLHGNDNPAVVVLGFRPDDALAYGRIIADEGGRIVKMVEFKDANTAERAVNLCNSGLMAVRAADLWPLLARIGNDNAAQEYYLPDIVMIALTDGRPSAVIETAAWEVAGINSRAELATVERAWQDRRRLQAMDDGATLIAPETVWFSHDTRLGRDVVVEPNVVFGPNVTVGDFVTIHAFSCLEGATVANNAEIGPYARLRPGADIGEMAKVGNFVEIKKAKVCKGAKINHLSYIGDAEVGEQANVGAGTITCNYDGFFKYQTVIGKGAFIGSNSALVAPVNIGDGAIIGAGSVVTRDVAANALALARGEQRERSGWAARFRSTMQAKKDARNSD